MSIRCWPLIAALLLLPAAASAEPESKAHYLANAGVMVVRGDTRIMFDPLFRNDFGMYDLVPAEMEQAILEGLPPFDGIDAVFISHTHEDHFNPALMKQLLDKHGAVHFFAPAQAVAELIAAGMETGPRVHSIELDNFDPPMRIEVGDLLVEAVRIPHGGWPGRHAHVENIAFRVTIDQATSVVHLGDADVDDEHFEKTAPYWNQAQPNLALPPYWFFLSPEGNRIVAERIDALHATGMHVPTEVPDDPAERREELQDVDLFTQPGETRAIPESE
jgi:L-ascorbate metabolism protein UlaG (beta-lactamase superfamily)